MAAGGMIMVNTSLLQVWTSAEDKEKAWNQAMDIEEIEDGVYEEIYFGSMC